MKIELYPHQQKALDQMHNGCVLCGGVGSGKSRTSISYFFAKVCGGTLDFDERPFNQNLETPRDLYIITTARKRDTFEWEEECGVFRLSCDAQHSIGGVKVTIDSWNNIHKYDKVYGAFFIFDEQRVVGSGKWVKSFIKIAKKNRWILLTATPGDNWSDYIPVFVANGFYKNKTEFLARHAVWSRFTKFPKIDRYVETRRLEFLRKKILVDMPFTRSTIRHDILIKCEYDKALSEEIQKKRWNPFEDCPIADISQLCYLLRKVTNQHPSRLELIRELINEHPKVIIFYNFDYELEILRTLDIPKGEWNGHKHEPIPQGDTWAYLVQYTAGAEGWNCIETDTTIFYSQNYSYKIMVQAAGRIDRLNTPYHDLYYYHLRSSSKMDLAIARALKNKKSFNDRMFMTIK